MSREAVSLNEAAQLLDVSRWTIYRLIKEGKIESFSIRRCRRIDITEIQRFASLKPPKLDVSFGYVYFIQAGEFTKIGVTNNVGQRLAGISAQSPVPVRLLGVLSFPLSEARKREFQFHQQFAEFRHHGEWFRLSTVQIETVFHGRANGTTA